MFLLKTKLIFLCKNFINSFFIVFTSFTVLWSFYGYGFSDEELYETLRTGDKESIQELINKGVINVHTRDKYHTWPLLHWVVSSGWTEMALMLIEKGADIHAIDWKNADTPLHIAVRYEKTKTAETLIDHGANINAINNDNKTPLLVAANRNYRKETTEMLLKKGANVHAKDNSGQTALHINLNGGGWLRMPQLLIDYGADVHAKDDFGRTALYLAVFYNLLDIVPILMDHGAKPDVKTYNENLYWLNLPSWIHDIIPFNGDTPLDVIKSPEMKKLLESYPRIST